MSRASSRRSPRVAVLYHYFWPDDVVSAQHIGQLAAGLAARGFEVEAWPCRRGCRDERFVYRARERWRGVDVRRVWRPSFRQASFVGRIANSIWMLAAWVALGAHRRVDAIVVGSDPMFGVLVAPLLRRRRRCLVVAHWAFDLYPEAAVADGLLRANGRFDRSLRWLLSRAYAACDLIADLGPCMRRRLEAYDTPARRATLVPWAISEPEVPPAPDPAVRRRMFGDARLGLLYSGNFGRAHGHEDLLALARRLRGSGIALCFAVRGNRAETLRRAIQLEDTNVRVVDFVPESELDRHLASADVHLASLGQDWSGIVVPSKFFGSLSAGRPVLFAGPPESALGAWIREHEVGWVLEPGTIDAIAGELLDLAEDPGELLVLQRRCFDLYHREFAARTTIDRWADLLRETIRVRRGPRAPTGR